MVIASYQTSTKKSLYLVDTREEVSILPANTDDHQQHQVFTLLAESEKKVATCSKRYVCLNMGLCRLTHWIFVVIDGSIAIIGVDMLSIDTSNRRMADGNTELSFFVTSLSEYRLCLITVKYIIDP